MTLREERIMKMRLILISRTATIPYASQNFDDGGLRGNVYACCLWA